MINYEPPQPVAPATSAAYGASQEYDRMAPIIQGYRAQQLQAGIAGAQAYNQGIGDVTQRTVAAGQQNAQLEALYQNQRFQQQQQQAEQAQRAAMQSAQMEQQAAEQRAQNEQQQRMLQQHYDLQFSQSQELQRQKYQQADSWIQQQLAAGTIDRETATNMSAKVRDLAAPLELQKMKSEAAFKDSQAKEQQALVERNTQQQLKLAGLAAQTVPERTVPTYKPGAEAEIVAELGPRPVSPMDLQGKLYDAEVQKRLKAKKGSVEYYTYTDTDGKTHIQTPKDSKADDDKALGIITPTAFNSTVRGEEQRVEAIVRRVQKADPNNTAENGGWSGEKVEEEIAKNLRAHFGLPPGPTRPTFEEYEAFMHYKATRGQATKGRRWGNPVEGTPAVQGGAGGPTAAVGSAPKAPPFNPTEPKTQTDVQKYQVNAFDKTISDIAERDDISHDKKIAATYNLQRSKSLLAEFGSFEAMPPKAQGEFLSARKFIQSLPPMPAKVQSTPAKKPATVEESINPYGGAPSY